MKLQYFGHLMWRVDSLEKTLMLGGIRGRRRRGWHGWMASLTWWTWVWVDSGSWWWTGRPGVLQFMGSQTTERLNWTELNWYLVVFSTWGVLSLDMFIWLASLFHLGLCSNITSSEAFLDQLFFFFPFIFISWRLITLQYCSGFCHTLTWISYGFTCVPHPDSLWPAILK